MTAEQISLMFYYEKLPVAVYLCDRSDLLVDYNSAAATLFEILPESGRSDWYPSLAKYDKHGRLTSDHYRPVTAAIKVAAGPVQEEFKFVLPYLSERYILVSSIAIWDDMGNYDGAVHTFSDVTALRKSEMRQAQLAAIVESSEDAIISKNLDGMITSWNRGATQIFGYSAEEAIGQHISFIIPPNRMAEEKMIISKVKAGQKVDHYETTRRHKNGRLIHISLSISPIRDSRGIIVGSSKIGRDITAQKLAEEKLQNYAAQLETEVAQRTHSLQENMRSLERAKEEVTRAYEKERELNQLKSRFVSMASHEFRTPLSAVQLSASLIEKYTQEVQSELVIKHLRKIKASVTNLNAILNDFLSLEKLDSGKINVVRTAIDLPEFIKDITEEMQPLTRPGQRITHQHNGTNQLVQLDRHLLHNCLINLVSNAIKYSGDNTSIELFTFVDVNEYHITVKDNGIGIPEDDQKHLFQPFFRAHNTGNIPGTGLGLNIVVRYIGLMSGTIDFESRPGHGSRFTLTFPTT